MTVEVSKLDRNDAQSTENGKPLSEGAEAVYTEQDGSHSNVSVASSLDVSSPEQETDEGGADSKTQGESSKRASTASETQPPLPEEPVPPPLPNEPVPNPQTAVESDDGWAPLWDANAQAYYFYNRFTNATQWENPRVPIDTAKPGVALNHDRIPSTSRGAPGTTDETTLHPAVAGGYNPAIHGSYDPNADYAQTPASPIMETAALPAGGATADDYAATATFNRFTGRFQASTLTTDNFNDDAKSRRQMSAFFDVDAAANSHEGKSLKAERQSKRLSKNEVKAFKEKRREKKEEKRRAWLRD